MIPIILSIGPVVIYSFSVLLVVAFLLGSFMFWEKGREEHYDEVELFDLILMAAIWGLVGARLGYVLVHFDDFGLNLWYWLAVWQKPGFFWLGIFIGAGAAVVRFCKKMDWDVFKVLDLLTIGVSLGQAVVNLGMFLGGGTAGKMTNLPTGMVFPGLFERRHPVGLYGFVIWMLVFWLLWWLEGKYRKFEWYQKHKGDARPGFLVFSYLALLGVVGFLLGLVSESVWVVYSINVNLLLRLGLIIVGISGLLIRSGIKWSDIGKLVTIKPKLVNGKSSSNGKLR